MVIPNVAELKSCRTKQGLSARALAIKASLNAATVAGIEKTGRPVAPSTANDDHTLLDKIPAPEEESTLERDELARIMREAVSKMKNDRARETVQAVYWEGMTLSEFARIKGVSKNTVNEWMQRAYSILRGDWRVVSLALVEGYDTEYNRYKGLSMFSSSRSSSVENVVIAQEDRELRQKALYAHLGRLAASCFVWAPPDKEQEDLDHGSQ